MTSPVLAAFWLLLVTVARADWESWWTYEGISGPDFWGRLNPRWSHCSKGRRQSPINIETGSLLFDPSLEPLKIGGDYVKGRLVNTGRGISFLVESHSGRSGAAAATPSTADKTVVISGGPFQYQYTLSNISLHFGRENDRGSEHTIDGHRFPGEIQIYAYNSQLYANWSEAKREPNGLAAISIFLLVSKQPVPEAGPAASAANRPNAALKLITGLLKNITKRGLQHPVESLSVLDLLPSGWEHYVTYEGSLTQPACHETVQWVLLNRPVYLSSYQFHMLRHSLKGDGHQDNFRPTQASNRRCVRANIVSHHHHHKRWLAHRETLDEDAAPAAARVEDSRFARWASSEIDQIDQHPAEAAAAAAEQLMAVKDMERCRPDQLRLYGYRANLKLNEEF